jgi:hypothetical protein
MLKTTRDELTATAAHPGRALPPRARARGARNHGGGSLRSLSRPERTAPRKPPPFHEAGF